MVKVGFWDACVPYSSEWREYIFVVNARRELSVKGNLYSYVA